MDGTRGFVTTLRGDYLQEHEVDFCNGEPSVWFRRSRLVSFGLDKSQLLVRAMAARAVELSDACTALPAVQ
jgi:hypothetical protein